MTRVQWARLAFANVTFNPQDSVWLTEQLPAPQMPQEMSLPSSWPPRTRQVATDPITDSHGRGSRPSRSRSATSRARTCSSCTCGPPPDAAALTKVCHATSFVDSLAGMTRCACDFIESLCEALRTDGHSADCSGNAALKPASGSLCFRQAGVSR